MLTCSEDQNHTRTVLKMINQIIWFCFLQFLYVSGQIRLPLLGRLTGSSAQPISVPLKNHQNVHYYGDIALGTPPKKFKMLFDSGSSDTIVLVRGFRRICTNPDPQHREKCLTQNFGDFDPVDSSTYKKIEGTFASKFVDQTELKGYLATDILELGNENSKIRVKIAVGMADTMIDETQEADGIFGLAFNMGSSFNPKIMTPFECMVCQAELPPQFSFYAKRGEDPNDFGGELYLGGYNPEYMASNVLTTVSVKKKTETMYFGWKIDLDGITVGGNSIPLEGIVVDREGTPGNIAIPDSGSSSIGGPPQVINLLLQYIFNNRIPLDVHEQKMFLCASLPDNLPEIAFMVKGVPLTLGPEDYITSQMDGLVCQSRLHALQTAKELILGFPFLQKYYTLFDYEKKEIQFAMAKQSPTKSEDRQPGITGKERLKSYPPQAVAQMREQLKQGYISITVPSQQPQPVDIQAQLQALMGGGMNIGQLGGMNMGQTGFGPQRQPAGFGRPFGS